MAAVFTRRLPPSADSGVGIGEVHRNLSFRLDHLLSDFGNQFRILSFAVSHFFSFTI